MNDHAVNAALVVVSVLLVLAGLETALAVGVVEPHPYANWDVENQHQTCELPQFDRPPADPRFHPEYGWTAPPGALYYRKFTPGQEWERHEINDEGFRDVYDTGDQGVVVLGDSFTHGTLASNDETYPHLLDRWNPDVSFHNYGIEGYGPQQNYLVYRDRAGEVDHDLVVIGHYRNDPSDSITPDDPSRPFFRLSNGELQQIHEPEIGDEFDDVPNYLALARSGEALDLTMAYLDAINEVAAENDAEVLVVTLARQKEVRSSGPDADFVAKQRERIDEYADDEPNVYTLRTRPDLTKAQKNRRVYGVYDGHPDDYGYYVIARTIQSWLVEHDDEVGVTVTAEHGDPPEGGLLSGVAGSLRSHTESYGFLSRRTGLLEHRVERGFGLGEEGSICD